MADSEINPLRAAAAAPRCSARSKRTGLPCRAPAVRGCRVCRVHGARGGAPSGSRNGNFRTGAHTREAIALRRLVSGLAREARFLCEAIE